MPAAEEKISCREARGSILRHICHNIKSIVVSAIKATSGMSSGMDTRAVPNPSVASVSVATKRMQIIMAVGKSSGILQTLFCWLRVYLEVLGILGSKIGKYISRNVSELIHGCSRRAGR